MINYNDTGRGKLPRGISESAYLILAATSNQIQEREII